MVQDGVRHESIFASPNAKEELNKRLVPGEGLAPFRLVPPDGSSVMARFRPFYTVGESSYYRMYFDLDKLPVLLWRYGEWEYPSVRG